MHGHTVALPHPPNRSFPSPSQQCTTSARTLARLYEVRGGQRAINHRIIPVHSTILHHTQTHAYTREGPVTPQAMLSLLIDQCGAMASELPQLVRLNELIRAEEQGTGGGFTAVQPQISTQGLPSPPLAAPTIAPAEVIHIGRQLEGSDTPSGPASSKDNTMLGFLLHSCVCPEEQAQCPMLHQLHRLLREEMHEGGANELANVNVSPLRAEPPAVASAQTSTAVAADTIKPPHQHDYPALSDATAMCQNWRGTAAAVPSSVVPGTAPPPPPPPPLDIPVPILPGAGKWKEATNFRAETAASPQPLAQPARMGAVSAAVVTSVAAAGTDKQSMSDSTDTFRAHSPRRLSAGTALPLCDDDEKAPTAVSPSTHASRTEETRAAPVALKVLAAGGSGRAELKATTSLGPRHTPHPPSYAGRMPCPVNEALAARNSATVRLLAGGGRTRASPETTLMSRPMSGFSKRFLMGLYERVSTPCAEALPSPAPRRQPHHTQHPPHMLAAGSGVGAARGRRASSERSLLGATLAEMRQSTQAGGTCRVSPTQRRVPLLAQKLATAPMARACTPLEHSYRHRDIESEPPRPNLALPHHSASGSPAVLPCARPLHRHYSFPRSTEGSSGTPAVEPFSDMMVVGVRIRLPSVGPARPRHA
ncbi:hypothetical protein, conserved [Leishmania tarentolae]|uniref:Uncharacterized protein n=1 Tax=Leishmania tarentolae TaxID=5689 RepID=A0A640KM21_LEITA|nr:hypothetical protein, conserved [Leishmania tarentolae]